MSARSLLRLGLAHVLALAALVLVALQPALVQARPLATSRPYPGAAPCNTTSRRASVVAPTATVL
jgi:hypothetical protein